MVIACFSLLPLNLDIPNLIIISSLLAIVLCLLIYILTTLESISADHKLLKDKLLTPPKEIQTGYNLSEIDELKYKKWRNKLPKKDYGAIGGGTWFMFCPTGIGTIIKVRRDDGKELDLTDVDNW